MTPTPDELQQLESAILTHVVPHDGRKHRIMVHLLSEFKKHPDRRAAMGAEELIKACPGEEGAKNPAGALRRIRTDLKKSLDKFFASAMGQEHRICMKFAGDGNYWPSFVENSIYDYVPLFWARYLTRKTRLMYPEPFFVIDATSIKLVSLRSTA